MGFLVTQNFLNPFPAIVVFPAQSVLMLVLDKVVFSAFCSGCFFYQTYSLLSVDKKMKLE